MLPGVRINVGKKGVSGTTIGTRGASITVGKQGVYANVGLPGTGLSFRKRIDTLFIDPVLKFIRRLFGKP